MRFLCEFSGIPDTINDDVEDTIIEACKDINIDVNETDIEACHRLPVRRNATNASKRVIVKFVSRKHAESILSKNFTLSSTDFSRLNINNKIYVNPSLCPYYRYLWGRCKDLQRRKMIRHVFCLGSVLAIKLTDQSLPLKIYHNSDIPCSQSDSIAKWWKNIFYFILGIDQGPLQQFGRFSFFTAIYHHGFRPLLIVSVRTILDVSVVLQILLRILLFIHFLSKSSF